MEDISVVSVERPPNGLGYVDGSTGSITQTETARALNPSKPPLNAMKIDGRRANNRLGANRRWIGDGFDGRTMSRDANREKEK